MKKRKGKLMWACRCNDGDYYLHPYKDECLYNDHNRETLYDSRAWPGPILKPGEGPVRVRVTIERERSQR